MIEAALLNGARRARATAPPRRTRRASDFPFRRQPLTEPGAAPARALLIGVASEDHALIGSDGSDQAIAAAAEHAVDEVTVLEDLYGSVEYKTHLAKVYVARAVKAALAAAS